MTTSELRVTTLQDPIEIDGRKVSEIGLRKPGTGDLRGLSLRDVLELDVDALIRLIPRISTPQLGPQEIAKIDLADTGVRIQLFSPSGSSWRGRR